MNKVFKWIFAIFVVASVFCGVGCKLEVESDKYFSIGDILFTDGTRIKAENVQYGIPDELLRKAFGVIGATRYGGRIGLVVGLQQDDLGVWAPSGTTGYKTNFARISVVCSGDASNYRFTGDLDGSDNWAYICSEDPSGTQNAATNYPIFHYANTYGVTAGLEGTEYENGWYVPSVAELYDVYTNKATIQTSIDAVGGFDMEKGQYWSSSQDAFYNYCAYTVLFDGGHVNGLSKFGYNCVLVLQALNSEQFNNYDYGTPSITSVEISTGGEGYEGELPVTIRGENLRGNVITSSDASFANVQYVSDNLVKATVRSDGNVGERTITVNCGATSGTGILKVVESEKCFSVGDILFTDGTRIKSENVQYGILDEQIEKAIGVIGVASYGGGTGLVVGLQDGHGEWAPSGTTGYKTNFARISVEYSGEAGNYTFTGDLDGSDNWEYICSMDPIGTQNAATNYPIFHYANTYGVTAGLEGTEYENGWYVPSVAELYDVYTNKATIQTSMDAVGGFGLNSSFWSSSQDAFYNYRAYTVLFDGGHVSGYNNDRDNCVLVLQALTSEQFNNYDYDYNYGTPSITNVELPIVGEGYEGELPVTIRGENLKGNVITSSDASFTNIQYVSDNLVKATVRSDGNVGERTITVNCGATSGTGILKVVESEKCFSVGDILFTDGTRIKAENVKYGVPDEQIEKAIGVIGVASYGGGTGLVVGLQDGHGEWAPSGTTGYKTNFARISVEYSGEAGNYTFTGDLDGSDNWEYICSMDPIGTQNAATNYPIFHYANTYGTTAGLEGTEYENGWYVPSVAELYDVYTNKATIQTSMYAVGGFDVESYWYWSSSQSSFYDEAYCVFFYDGYVYGADLCGGYVNGNGKGDGTDVLVLQALNSEQFNNYNYGTPSITSVEISQAGEGYVGDLLVTIRGENLKGNVITSNDTSFKNVQYVSDNLVKATVSCDGNVGERTITVTSGTSSESGTVKVVESEKCFSVGDILFRDGTRIKAENVKYGVPDEQLEKAIGVIGSAPYGGGTGLVVGLHRGDVCWAPSGTIGYETNFTGISVEYSGEANNYTFTGDLDGSDNWEYICSKDPIGTQNASTNYPVFDVANTYGVTAGLAGTEYENGWYVPSIAELYDVYTNRNIIKTSMDAAGGFDVESGYYWSSSQSSSDYDRAYKFNFDNGNVDDSLRVFGDYVLVLQALNAE